MEMVRTEEEPQGREGRGAPTIAKPRGAPRSASSSAANSEAARPYAFPYARRPCASRIVSWGRLAASKELVSSAPAWL